MFYRPNVLGRHQTMQHKISKWASKALPLVGNHIILSHEICSLSCDPYMHFTLSVAKKVRVYDSSDDAEQLFLISELESLVVSDSEISIPAHATLFDNPAIPSYEPNGIPQHPHIAGYWPVVSDWLCKDCIVTKDKTYSLKEQTVVHKELGVPWRSVIYISGS